VKPATNKNAPWDRWPRACGAGFLKINTSKSLLHRSLALFATLLIPLSASSPNANAQSANDPNEGTKIERDTENQLWRMKWWSREGRTYLIQHSEDLSLWTWMDVIVTGNDSIREVGLNTNAEKFFMRLVYTDESTADPNNEDWDGDGVSNYEELLNQTDPFSNKDTDGDSVSDDKEIADGTDPNDFFNGQPPVLRIAGGNNQGDLPGSTLLKPLTVRLTNQAGTPAANREIAFTITEGEGTLSIINSGQTDEQGLASTALTVISDEWQMGILVAATYENLSVVFRATVGNPDHPPQAPGRPTIQQNPGETTALVEWEDRSNNEIGFHIERSTNNQTWTRIATLPVNSTTFSDSGLTPDRPHSYRIVVFNDAP
jgi:hypothetical protein